MLIILEVLRLLRNKSGTYENLDSKYSVQYCPKQTLNLKEWSICNNIFFPIIIIIIIIFIIIIII